VDLARYLPMAFVMIAGPQILSAIFLATSEQWWKNSTAFLLGASMSISAVVAGAYALGIRAAEGGASDDTFYFVALALLAIVAVRIYRKRGESEPPRWMGKLATAEPGLSFKLGFLLLGVFPTDILTSVAVGSYLAGHGDPWWHAGSFVALTLFLLAIPCVAVIALGSRAKTTLPRVRDWMNDNSWVVSEAVVLFFVLLMVNNLLG
jgi:hypothetical protein